MLDTEILKILTFTPGNGGAWGLPAYWWGPPGIGKSAIIEGFCADWQIPCEVLTPGERGHGGFGAVPVPVQQDGSTVITYPVPEWALRMQQAGVGFVFVDEMTTATPTIQPALLGLVNARRIGATNLLPTVRVMGAMNPVDQAAGGWDIAPPLANRAGHFDVDSPEADQWCDWLIGGPAARKDSGAWKQEQDRVLGVWDGLFAEAKGLVSGFIKREPSRLYDMPKASNPGLSKAWPSPRTWELATRALAGCQAHGAGENMETTMVEAFVGPGTAQSFLAWRASLDLPDPMDILTGKVKFKHDKNRLDRTIVTLNACAGLCIQKSLQEDVQTERATTLWGVLGSLQKDGGVPPDVIFRPAAALCKNRLYRGIKEATPVTKQLLPMMRAANIMDGA